MLAFERELADEVRQLGRQIVEQVYNQLEPNEPESLPHYVHHEAGEYRRLNRKTPNREVATLFGKITLWRHGYRYVERDTGEPTIFPLEIQLGLVEGATPALASVAAAALAETGATQDTALGRLRSQHGVVWGVKKLRAVTENVSAAMETFRREHQARKIVAWLRQAHDSTGRNRPVLAVGRDGITLRTQPHSFFEVASTATLTVYDRNRQRLGTVYLAYAPELGQQTMTDELTSLLTEVFRQAEDLRPRLAYLTDAGDNETGFYRRVLKPDAAPVDRQTIGVAVDRRLLPCLATADHDRRGPLPRRTRRQCLGRANAQVAQETQRAVQGAARRRGLEGPPPDDERPPQGIRQSLQLSPRADQAHAICRVSQPGLADRQRRHRSGLQDGLHPTAQTLRHALVARRCANDPEPPCHPS